MTKVQSLVLITGWLGFFCGGYATPSVSEPSSPEIRSFLKKEVYDRVMNREVMTHASLDEKTLEKKNGKKRTVMTYDFYLSFLVRASLNLTRDILTRYELYEKMIPFVRKSTYDPKKKKLQLEGGIWKFRIRSQLQFDEKSKNWLNYQVVGGHLKGTQGEILFESHGPKGTLVLLRGRHSGMRNAPPGIVMEQGAEIVFSFTAKKMRSYIEEKKRADMIDKSNQKNKKGFKKGIIDERQTPQPRRRL